jgi:hypothetical protein
MLRSDDPRVLLQGEIPQNTHRNKKKGVVYVVLYAPKTLSHLSAFKNKLYFLPLDCEAHLPLQKNYEHAKFIRIMWTTLKIKIKIKLLLVPSVDANHLQNLW